MFQLVIDMNPNEYEAEIARCNFKPWSFRVKAKSENYQDELKVRQVSHLIMLLGILSCRCLELIMQSELQN